MSAMKRAGKNPRRDRIVVVEPLDLAGRSLGRRDGRTVTPLMHTDSCARARDRAEPRGTDERLPHSCAASDRVGGKIAAASLIRAHAVRSEG